MYHFIMTVIVLLFFCLGTVSAQNVNIDGIVLDSKTGEGLPGVTIMVKGEQTGTVTNINGEFRVKVTTTNSTLIVSYIGYKTETINLQGKNNIKILLNEDSRKLDEVVVVGYAVQKKESVVGAISQVKGADLMKAGVTSVSNALAGRVPGLITVQQTGLPGSNDSKIYIRGMSSFTGSSSPLVLVDGVESTMNDINPSEVESISVLKDASATAVFGVKGANGVILITTKRGQEGKMEISVTFDQTMKKPTTGSIQDNSYNTLMARNNLYRNTNQYNLILGDNILEHYRKQDMPYVYPDVDTWNYNVKNFTMDTQASISAKGGTKNAKYFLTLSYLHEGDMIKSNQTLYDPSYKYDRVNYRMNFDFTLSKTTKLSLSSGGYVGTDSHGGSSGIPAKVLTSILVMPPYMTPYYYPESFVAEHPSDLYPDISGRIAGSLLPTSNKSTVDYIHNQMGTEKFLRDRLTTDITLVQNLDFITKGLNAKLSVNYSNESSWKGGGYSYSGEYYVYTPVGESYEWQRYISANPDNYSMIKKPYQNTLTQYRNPINNFLYSGQIDYSRSFDKHNISALGVFSRRISQTGATFPHYEENWVARATYNYDSRYLFEVNVGIAGSEQFAPSNRFGTFPAIALGWNIAKESFITTNLPQINNFKVRYSYGEGGYDGTDGFLYLSEYYNWNKYSLGTTDSKTNTTTVREGEVPNINASWERSIKNSLGFDVGLFDNTFTCSVDFYDEKRDGILMTRRSVSDMFGQGMKKMNVGSTKKHGYEIEVGYNNHVGAFKYWLKANYNFNENRITSMDDPGFTLDYLKSEGKPIGSTLSTKNIGYYQNMDEIMNYSLGQSNLVIGGDKVLDFNGDAAFTNKDAVAMAFTNRPNKSYSFSAGFDFKNFDFNFMIQGVSEVSKQFGNITNPMWSYDPGAYVLLKGNNDVWTPDNRNSTYSNWGGENATSKGIVDASYLKLKSLEVGYTLKGRTLKSLGLNSARVALQGSNLITIAPGYKLGDPENEGSVDSYGNQFIWALEFYPLPRRLTVAIKLNF